MTWVCLRIESAPRLSPLGTLMHFSSWHVFYRHVDPFSVNCGNGGTARAVGANWGGKRIETSFSAPGHQGAGLE